MDQKKLTEDFANANISTVEQMDEFRKEHGLIHEYCGGYYATPNDMLLYYFCSTVVNGLIVESRIIARPVAAPMAMAPAYSIKDVKRSLEEVADAYMSAYRS